MVQKLHLSTFPQPDTVLNVSVFMHLGMEPDVPADDELFKFDVEQGSHNQNQYWK